MHADLLSTYAPTIAAMGSAGALLLVQLIVVDVAALRRKHPPGMPVAPDAESFLFRASRVHANTNESLAAFALLAVCALLSGASPAWTNGCAVTYLAARVAHMLFYYRGAALQRSIAFAVGLIALVVLAVVAIAAALS